MKMGSGHEEADFEAYTTKWTEPTNCGGLLKVNKTTFTLFKLLKLEISRGVHSIVLFSEKLKKKKKSC